jgi:ketosteroid isomerase-like protein
MKKLLMILPMVFLLCFTFGCKQAEEVAEEPAVDIEAEVEAVREANTAWQKASEAQDMDAVMSFFADDFVRLRGGTNSIQNKAEEREGWSKWYADGWKSTWEPTKVEVAGSGDLAYVYGVYHNERVVDGEIQKSQGGFLNVWKRQADGSWKLAAIK